MSALNGCGLDMTTNAERWGSTLRYPLRGENDGVYGIKVYTRGGIERVARFAAELAARRKAEGHRGLVTIGGKWNINPTTDGLFKDVASATIAETPGIACNAILGDDLGRRMVMSPEEFDVVLLPNLLGDILSDVASGVIGGLGMAPSGGYGETRAYFEPIHGSAPDIAGRNSINPTATLLSAAMMLDYLGFAEQAGALDAAIRYVIGDAISLTPDLGGSGSTTDFARAVADRLS
jgi:isocitrate/isopropylmalate dehydrogenase